MHPVRRVNAGEGETARFRTARVVLARKWPYLYPVLFQAVFVETLAVPTAGVDDRLRIYFNPDWTRPLVNEELLGLLAHEVLHWVRGHTGKRGEALLHTLLLGLEALGYPPGEGTRALARELANLAADLAVNGDLEAGGFRLPSGAFLPKNFGLEPHLTTEAYADILLRLVPPNREGKGGSEAQELSDLTSRLPGSLRRALEGLLRDLFPGPGPEATEGLDEEAPGLSEAWGQVVRRQVATEVVKVLRHTKTRGDVPLGLARWAEELLSPKVRWEGLLRQAVHRELVTLRQRRLPSYSVAHRRSEELYPFLIPGRYGYKPKVAVVVDTSRSVSDRMLAQALAEVRRMVRQGARVWVYSVDAAVHHVERLFRPDQIKALYGGGGTDMGVGLERALADGHDLIVVLTDGYTPWPGSPPRARVVVGLFHEDEAPPLPPPWAKVVLIPVE